MNELIPIEFKGEVVITTKLLAIAYETNEDNIKQNFNRNKNKFTEGKHYYKLEGKDLDYLRVTFSHLQISSKTRTMYLWTKRGASRHCKMLDTDKAWDMFDMLEESYFNGDLPQLTETQKLILIISDPRQDKEIISQAINKLRQIEYNEGYDNGYSIGYEKGREETEQKLIDELNKRKNGNDVLLSLTQCASMLYGAWIKELNNMNIYKLTSGDISGYLVHKQLLIKEYLPKLYKGEYIYDLNGEIRYEDRPHYKLTEDFKEFVSQPGYSFTGRTVDNRKDTIQFNIYFLERFVNEHKEGFLKYMSGFKG